MAIFTQDAVGKLADILNSWLTKTYSYLRHWLIIRIRGLGVQGIKKKKIFYLLLCLFFVSVWWSGGLVFAIYLVREGCSRLWYESHLTGWPGDEKPVWLIQPPIGGTFPMEQPICLFGPGEGYYRPWPCEDYRTRRGLGWLRSATHCHQHSWYNWA